MSPGALTTMFPSSFKGQDAVGVGGAGGPYRDVAGGVDDEVAVVLRLEVTARHAGVRRPDRHAGGVVSNQVPGGLHDQGVLAVVRDQLVARVESALGVQGGSGPGRRDGGPDRAGTMLSIQLW